MPGRSFLDTPLPDDPLDLTGRVAIITGGGTGIGAAAARLLARRGASVVVAARDGERLGTVADEIAATGAAAVAVATDVRDEDQIRRLVASTLDRHGRIDIVVNNAGGNRHTPLDELATAGWDNAFALNVRGPFLLTREAGAAMLASGGGVFVNISSFATRTGVRGGTAYAAAKAALENLTHQTAVEWGDRGIRANGIAVGAVASAGALRAWERSGMLDRLRPIAGTPDDIAWTILYLASDASRFVNGQVLVAAGVPVAPG